MTLSELLSDLWYEVRGLHAYRAGIETLAPCLAEVLKAMVPTFHIVASAGIDLRREWDTTLEEEIINAHVAHLVGKWQPTHNAMMDLKAKRHYRRLHKKAMLASRAYGETLFTYIEFKRLFLSPQYLTKTYYRKQRDGRQWDALANRYARALLDELYRIRDTEPQIFRLLAASDETLEGIQRIGAEIQEFWPFNHSVSDFQ